MSLHGDLASSSMVGVLTAAITRRVGSNTISNLSHDATRQDKKRSRGQFPSGSSDAVDGETRRDCVIVFDVPGLSHSQFISPKGT